MCAGSGGESPFSCCAYIPIGFWERTRLPAILAQWGGLKMMRRLYFRMARKDMTNSKTVSIATLLFIAVAAMLVALAAILAVSLAGAIGNMMAQAETPHFMQMHSGDIDQSSLDAFAERDRNVAEYQALEFLNIDNSEIAIDGESLIGSVQDNGFSMQSGSFDYLMNLDSEIIYPADGEAYVPLAYMKDNTAQIGDALAVCGRHFTVAGFVRDSQMNASMSSSKRFLISENDYAALRGYGAVEYLIEFRVHDTAKISELENAYIAAGLPANGPALTYTLFQLINALSDGLMIAVILLVSLIIVAIALLCIRFTLLAKIEDEYREIGVMKAIGLRLSDIRRVYLAKYAILAAVACAAGLALSFLLREPMIESIRLNMGESGQDGPAAMFGLAGVALIFLAIITYVNGVLRRFRKISAADALRFGAAQDKPTGTRRMALSRNRLLSTNIFLGVKDVMARKKLYMTMLAALALCGFITIVPLNLSSTLADDSFAQYMGIGAYDMMVNLQQTDGIGTKAAEMERALKSDDALDSVSAMVTKTFTALLDNGTTSYMKVELGNHALFPIAYASGHAPSAQNELAISAMLADDIGKTVGDTITLMIGGRDTELAVCGIYSDVTNGGKTAKAVFEDSSANIMWYVIGASANDPSQIESIVEKYRDRFTYAKVADMGEFADQTLGSIGKALNAASYLAIAAALIISSLITLLFMKMLIAKDRYSIAVMKALGFTSGDVKAQYISRAALVFIISLALSAVLAATLGEGLAGLLLSSIGITSFKFAGNPIGAYLLCPLALLCVVLFATTAAAAHAGRVNISDSVKE
jgi:putative ABC transport system permease protein